MRIIGVAIAGFAVVALALYYWWPQSEITVQFRPGDSELVALGKRLYTEQCASCHGAELQGQENWRQPLADNGGLRAPPHDETGHTWHHPDPQLFALTKFGGQKFAPENFKSNMPGFEDTLSDREILAVLSFIKSSWPKEIRERHDELNARAGQG